MLLVTVNPAASISTLLLIKYAAENNIVVFKDAAIEDKYVYTLYNYRKYILYILFV